jgi:hypothetical protein
MKYYNNSKKREYYFNNEKDIILEEFISYLDIEDYLRLLGLKHWSIAGSECQIMIRNFIAKIIFERQKLITDREKHLYDSFVKKLKPNDLIITFNYDTILEEAFERNNIPFRFYWEKLKSINDDETATIDFDNDDIILHKMHGSIDWVSDKYFTSKSELCVWNKHSYKFNPKLILPGPYLESNPLDSIYRISNLDEYFSTNEIVIESPLIISPSMNKILLLNPLKKYWDGFIGNGRGSKRLIIIGFSLPSHDEYIRQPLYYVTKNFEFSANSRPESRISLVTYQKSKEDRKSFLDNYCFLNREITDCYFDGFTESIIDKIFAY